MSQMEYTEKAMFDKMDVAKGLASCGVILGHAIHQTNLEESSPFLYAFLFRFVFSATMPSFFLISGYLWSKARRRTAYEQLRNDARALLYPFFVLSIVFEALQVGLRMKPVSDIFPATKALLLYQTDMNALPSGVLWFLFLLFCFRQVATIVRASKYSDVINIVIIVASTVFIWFVHNCYFLGLSNWHYYVFFFIGSHEGFRRMFLRRVSIGIIVFWLLVAVALAFGMAYYRGTFLNSWLIVLKLVNFAGVLGLFGLVFAISGVMERILRFIGVYSIFPYTFHMPVFTVLKMVIPLWMAHITIVYVLLLTLASIVGCQIIGAVIRGIPYFYPFLYGHKLKRTLQLSLK